VSDVAAAPPPLTLHPLVPGNASELQAVYAAGADYFARLSGGLVRADQAERDLAETAGDDARHILGIFLNDEMVGVVDLRFADPGPFDVRLGLILLGESHRGQGLGGWALRILEEWLRQATPSQAIVLAVLAQDLAAQRFFRRLGYDFTGQAIRVVVGDYRPRLLMMRKDLDAPL
jgi:RimJ/RimL family protein N-acetyltransferase